MKLIAAVDKNWAIGNKGKLLARIPADQRFFRENTTGHVVVLGRKTLEEFPKSKPLRDRENIILSTNPDYEVEGATIAHSLEELFEILKKYESDDIYIIGGQSIYSMLLPYCNQAIITKIDMEYEADAFVDNLDKMDNWEMTWSSEIFEYEGIKYQFTIYDNNSQKPV